MRNEARNDRSPLSAAGSRRSGSDCHASRRLPLQRGGIKGWDPRPLTARRVAWPVLLLMALANAPLWAAAVSQQELARALASRPDRNHGQQLFLICAGCHGASGNGSVDGRIPVIAGQHFSVLVAQLVDFRNARRLDVRMQAVSQSHRLPSAQDIADVASYVSELPAPPAQSIGDGKQLVFAADVYGRLCASCHGVTAAGDGAREVPRLAGQNYNYLLQQLSDAASGRRPRMSADHLALLQRFMPADLGAVADYLSRLMP